MQPAINYIDENTYYKKSDKSIRHADSHEILTNEELLECCRKFRERVYKKLGGQFATNS